MNNNESLLTYFPNYLNSEALFTKMSTLGAPWSSEVGQDMDDAYFTMYSGIKPPSQFVKLHLYDGVANTLTIARIIYGIYGQSWKRLWEAALSEYVPIDNYNMLETVARTKANNRTIDRTNDLSSTVDGTETRTSQQDGNQTVNGNTTTTSSSDSNGTNSLEHGEQIKRDTEADGFTFGFNSEEKVPTAVQIETGTDLHSGTDITNTTDHSSSDGSGTQKSDSTDHMTGIDDIVKKDVRADKVVENTLDTDDEKEDVKTTRKGNIGVTSTQQLLQQEFDLWKWNFYMRVFEDTDKFLTLSVYNHCTNPAHGWF